MQGAITLRLAELALVILLDSEQRAAWKHLPLGPCLIYWMGYVRLQVVEATWPLQSQNVMHYTWAKLGSGFCE